jgi:hypothetical protein
MLRRRVLAALGIAALSAGAVPMSAAPAAAATATVPCSVSALVAAIDAANATPGADVISLAPHCTYTLSDANNGQNGLPLISGDITINGRGSTITRASSAPDFRFFHVLESATLSLNTLTLRGGRASDCQNDPLGFITGCGGAIESFGTVNVNDSHVDRNLATSAVAGDNVEGGAIENFGTLNVTSSSFDSNTATFTGSGTDSEVVGGAIANEGSLSVDSTVLTRNTIRLAGTGTIGGSSLQLADGGAIGSFGPATIARSVINGNHVYGSDSNDAVNGGAIANIFATMTISSTTVTNNGVTARLGAANGGGMITAGTHSVLTVTDSLFVGNTAAAPSLAAPSGGCVPETSSVATSGAIFAASGKVSIASTTLAKNTVNADGGCGTALGGAVRNAKATLSFARVQVLNNSVSGAPAHGGGIASGAAVPSMTIDRSTIAGNAASGPQASGGGIFNLSTGVLTVTRSHVTGNTPDDCSPPSSACTP